MEKEDRHDIIQAVEFHDPEKLIAFCEEFKKHHRSTVM